MKTAAHRTCPVENVAGLPKYQPTASLPPRARWTSRRRSEISARAVSQEICSKSPSGASAQRMTQTIRVVDDLGESDALGTGEPLRQRVVLVGPQRDQPITVDGGDHPAERLTDPAVSGLVLRHVPSPPASGCRPKAYRRGSRCDSVHI